MDQNNPFNKLGTEGLEDAKDVLGGGFGAIDSDVYDGTIKAAYAGKSNSSNAMNMTFVIGVNVNGQDREYREVVYVTNRQSENFYTKGDKKFPLPGFTTANDICLLATGHDLASQDFEEKVVKLYNHDAGAEVPTKVQMATGLIGKPISIAVLKQLESKTKKNDATGEYEPIPGETRETNVIDKAFHTDSGRTVSEVVRKLDKGEFRQQWLDKNKGQVRDKTSKAAGKEGVPGQAAAAGAKPAQTKGLFG